MFVFVVPLKSARAAVSWEVVTRLVRRTLRSACAQTSPAFRVLVMCHEVPAVGFHDQRLEFLPVDFPPPGPDVAERRRDKGRKVLRGLLRALTFAPCHAMILDADDCVSNRLVTHVARHSSANGWYFRKGYLYREGMETIRLERLRFHHWCGSSHIIRPEILDLPRGPVDSWYLKHKPLAAQLRANGSPLQMLPFPGAVYNVSHGDNFHHYAPILWPRSLLQRWIRRLVFDRQLTTAIREEFGLYPLDATGSERLTYEKGSTGPASR